MTTLSPKHNRHLPFLYPLLVPHSFQIPAFSHINPVLLFFVKEVNIFHYMLFVFRFIRVQQQILLVNIHIRILSTRPAYSDVYLALPSSTVSEMKKVIND